MSFVTLCGEEGNDEVVESTGNCQLIAKDKIILRRKDDGTFAQGSLHA